MRKAKANINTNKYIGVRLSAKQYTNLGIIQGYFRSPSISHTVKLLIADRLALINRRERVVK